MPQTRSASSNGGAGASDRGDAKKSMKAAVSSAADDGGDRMLPLNSEESGDNAAAAVASTQVLPRKRRQATKSPAPPDMTGEDEMAAAASETTEAEAAVEEEASHQRISTPINEMKSSDMYQILHNSSSMEDDHDDEGDAGGSGGWRAKNLASVSLNASFEAAAAAAAVATSSIHVSPKKRSKSKDNDTCIYDAAAAAAGIDETIAESNSISTMKQSSSQQQLQQQQQQQVPDTPLRPPTTNSKVSKRQKGGGILFSPKPVYSKCISGDRKKKGAGVGGLSRRKRPVRNTSIMGGGGVAAAGLVGVTSISSGAAVAGGGSEGEGSGSDFQAAAYSTDTISHLPRQQQQQQQQLGPPPSSPLINATTDDSTTIRAAKSSPATPFRFHAFPESLPRVHPRGLTHAKEGGLLSAGAGSQFTQNNPTPFRLDESFGTSHMSSTVDGKQYEQQQQRQLRGGLPTQRMNLRPKPSPPEEDVPMRSPHSPATRRLFRSNPTTLPGGEPMIQLTSTLSSDVAESNAETADALLVARNDSNDQNDISGEWSEPTEMSMTNKLIRMTNVPSCISALHHHQEGDEDDETNTVMEEDIIGDEAYETQDAASGLAGTKLNFNSPTAAVLKSTTPDHYPMNNLDVSPIYGDDVGMAEKGDGSPMKGMDHENDDDRSIGGNVGEIQSSYLPVSVNSANADNSFSTGNASETTVFTRPNPRRTSRPMPDTSAFDVCTPSQSSHRSKDSGVQSHKTSDLLCPPTPIRTPAWAHNEAARAGSGQVQHLQRANSLIATKVLAECPPRVFDNLSVLEDSMLEHDVSGSVETGQHLALTTSFLPVEEKDEHDSFEGDEGSNSVGGAENDTYMEEMPILKSEAIRASKQKSSVSIEDLGPVTFSDFENVGILGSGAFADVFKVRSKKDQAFYAIKRTRRQFRGVKDRERAMAEVNTMKRLQSALLSGASSSATAAVSQQKSHSDGVSETHSKTNYGLYLLIFIRAWQQDGFFYCQTELCSRATCRHLRLSLTTDWEKDVVKFPSLASCLDSDVGIKKGRPQDRLIPEKAIWQICHDISRGLFHIHSHGMVHYDIKPSNIFFVVTKWGTICKIGDFGLAGDIGASDDGQEGDTSYMANELLSSSSRHPGADIFSLGLTLYELAASATWALPREGDRWHDLRSGSHTPDLPATRNESLVKLIQLMIQPDPKQRPSAEEITERADVKRASASSDSFLSQYVGDVARNDSRREKEIESAEAEARRRSTTPVSSILSPYPSRFQRNKPSSSEE